MTRDEILNMPAGKPINALMASKVIGANYWRNGTTSDYDGEYPMYSDWEEDIFYYTDPEGGWLWIPSTDLPDAWDIIKKMSDKGFNMRLEVQGKNARVTFWSKRMTKWGPEPVSASADTVPLAICRAALLAVEGL
jgi:hypothetical protein